jgi:Family of unknown function (DUF6158)
MTDVVVVLTDLYAGVDRMTSDEVGRRAVAGNVPADVIAVLQAVPEGEYSLDEMLDALDAQAAAEESLGLGIEAAALADDDLLRELGRVHQARNDTFRHGSDDALEQLNRRTAELESEYLRRFPQREIDQRRLRSGARGAG